MAMMHAKPAARLLVSRRTVTILLPTVLASIFCLALASPEERYILGPMLAMINASVWMLVKLWDRDRILPAFDAGVFCMAATLLYSIIPLLNFLAGGLEFTALSDSRLSSLHPTAMEVGAFAWRHVLYLVSFVFVYVLARGKGDVAIRPIRLPDRATRQTIFVLFLLFTAYFLVIQLIAGPVDTESYGEMVRASAQQTQLPLFVRQMNNYGQIMLFIFKLSILLILVSRCRFGSWRFLLFGWLSMEVALSLARMGSRTGTALFLLAAGMLYHRLVKPFQLKFAIPAGLAFLTFFMAYGIARDIGVENLLEMRYDVKLFSVTNEFQAVFGTSYDLLNMRETGRLEVPWQVYVNDIIQVFPPQQFVPFEKFDASSWYVNAIGQSDTGSGYMWGVISQSIIGLDWIELIIRGALLGWILARVHRWYVRQSSGFFANLVYIWLCLWVYYTFRDTTFSLLARLLYGVLPALLLIQYAPKSLRSTRPRGVSI